jgi:hypothetical protein
MGATLASFDRMGSLLVILMIGAAYIGAKTLHLTVEITGD